MQTGCVDAANFMRAKIEGGLQNATFELVCQMQRDMTMKVSCCHLKTLLQGGLIK